MNKQILEEILKSMAIKASLANIYKDEEEYKNNMRKCPFYSELAGMEHTLKIMGIEFEYEYNKEVTKITAIKANDIYIPVK